jgi:hypothetical protein
MLLGFSLKNAGGPLLIGIYCNWTTKRAPTIAEDL